MTARDEFLAARQTGIGGSDVAVLLGISPFKTKLELYLEKVGQLASDDDNSRTRAGRVMENVIATMYADRQGVKVRRINSTLRHPKYPWLIAHIDRDVVGQSKGVEIKNVSPRIGYLWGRDGEPDAVAEYYIPQPHHYMLVMDYPAFDVAAYFGGDDLRVFPMERDREMDELIIDAAADFWHQHVVAGVPPEPEYEHPTTTRLLQRIHPGTNGATVEADEMIRHWAAVCRDSAKKAAEYEAVAASAKAHLLAFMGDAATLKLDDKTVFRRKEVKRKGYAVGDTTYVDARFSTTKE